MGIGGFKGLGDSISGGFKDAVGKVLGNGDSPGYLGTSQFTPNKYDVNEDAFKNSNYNQGLYDQRRSDFAQQMQQAMGRTAPTVNGVQIATGPQDQVRARQMTLADQLTAQAAGQGPSLATMQLQQATDRNLAQSMAAAASMRGASGGLGLRNLNQQQTALQGQAARDSAMARMQEQLSAREQLSGVLNGTRTQDIGLATSQAGLTQSANLANQQAALKQLELNDAQQRFYTQGQMANDAAQSDAQYQQKQALMALEKLKADQVAGMNNVAFQGYDAASKGRSGFANGLLGGAAEYGPKAFSSLMAMSDENVKKNVKDGRNELQKFLDSFSITNGDEEKKKEEPSMSQKVGTSLGKGFGASVAGGLSAASDYLKDDPVKIDESSPAPMTGQYATAMAAHGGKVTDMMDDYSLEAQPAPSAKPEEAKDGTDISALISKLGPMLLMAASEGGRVPGKAKVPGDSYANDTVPVLVSPGEVIVPRTAAEDPKKLQEFVDSLGTHKYNYKNPEHGDASYISPMAQEMEKSELGKGMVVDTPEGKMVHYGRAGGVMLATAAMLNERMKEIEAKLGKGKK